MRELRILYEASQDAIWPEEGAIYLLGIQHLLELDQISHASTHASRCAWCLSEQGMPMRNGSHGICARHADLQRRKQQVAA
jgi:hypothetical protein